jgi:hypothetical protein
VEEVEELTNGEKQENFSNGPITPKYTLLHSYPVDMGQFFNQGA